uniref:Ripply transcriptional repressor 2 n=1 Tax=Echeneis naucrates TaxID=173247 RepID=A0A665V024_ECHNA
METLGDASKAQFGAGCRDLINTRFLSPVAHPLRTGHGTRQPREAMDTYTSSTSSTSSSGLTSVLTGDNSVHGLAGMWRPWTGTEETRRDTLKVSFTALSDHRPFLFSFSRLYWPKSRCFDYLYQDAEMLLRNYPVQATISLYEDSSSEEDSEEEDEEMEKEQN